MHDHIPARPRAPADTPGAKDRASFAATIERFSGFADFYDRYRPRPPDALAALLAQFATLTEPDVVVDLGCGTGLSSRYWARVARQVIGIEPSADMRAEAERRTHVPNLRLVSGFSHATGLISQCAQMVVCHQALHWMVPQATFEEARRLLRPGGVFAAIDYDYPPVSGCWRSDQAWMRCIDNVLELERAMPPERQAHRWGPGEHLARMRESGVFRHTREVCLSHEDIGDADRYIGLIRSHGGVMDLLKAGRTDSDIGLTEFDATVREHAAPTPKHWYWSARVRIGVV